MTSERPLPLSFLFIRTVLAASFLLSINFSECSAFITAKNGCDSPMLQKTTRIVEISTNRLGSAIKSGKEGADGIDQEVKEQTPLEVLRAAQEQFGGVIGSVAYPERDGDKENTVVEDVVLRFEGAGLGTSATVPWCFDQCHWGILEFRGEDRLKFLHGQCTNAIETARPGMVLDAAITTNLGRVVDLCKIAILPDRCLLICSPNRKKVLMETFDKFIFPADKVTLKEINGLGILTLAGQGNSTAKVLETLGAKKLPLPQTHTTFTQANGKKALLLEGCGLGPDFTGYTVLVPLSSLPQLVGAMGWWTALGGEEEWQKLRTRQGRPFPGKELTKEYNALESGLFHTVHFNKGCYIGQETLSKVNNANKLKTQLFGIQFPSGTVVEENTKIETEDGTRAGCITSVIQDNDGSTFGLAYVRAQAGTSAGIKVKVTDSAVLGTTVDISYPTRSDADAAEPPKRIEKKSEESKDEHQKQLDKEAEDARKAKKLEEMQKRLAAFQAKKSKASQ